MFELSLFQMNMVYRVFRNFSKKNFANTSRIIKEWKKEAHRIKFKIIFQTYQTLNALWNLWYTTIPDII